MPSIVADHMLKLTLLAFAQRTDVKDKEWQMSLSVYTPT